MEAAAVLLTAERISLSDLKETLIAAALHTTQDACALLTQQLQEADAGQPPMNVTTEPSVILRSAPPTSPMTIETPPPASVAPSSRRGSSAYNEFLSEMIPLVRSLCPQPNHKGNLSLAASLWSRYKATGSLDDILKAARADLEARAAIRREEDSPLRSVSILMSLRGAADSAARESMPDLEDA